MQEKKILVSTYAPVPLIVIFTVMLALNCLMPLHRDDYDYSLVWGTAAHVNSLSDVFESTYLHYLSHGGRAFTVFCLNFFLWLGKFPFDVINAALFTALVALIYVHARREVKFDEPIILAVTGLLTWLSLPHFGEVAVWKSGSTVYLWSAVPALLFLLAYNLKLAGRLPVKENNLFAAGMFALGLIAGCSVENLGVTVTLLAGAITFYWRKKKLSYTWATAGAVGSLIGLMILLAAPGNFVRYDEQGTGKGILAHIGNQIAGNAEMLLYLLPAILIFFCAVGVLRDTQPKKIFVSRPLIVVTIIFVVSYFCDSFISTTINNFFVNNVFPSFDTSKKFIERFENFMSKSEEMIIYWLIIFMIFIPLRRALGVKKPPVQETLKKFSAVRYATILFILALFNNMVMIFAPTFPARATFSSVCLILAGVVAVVRLQIVREKFSLPPADKILKAGALALGGFTIIAALAITYTMRQENHARIVAVKEAAANYKPVVRFEPIALKNRALRHVFFVDFDNSVTTGGLCKFYGINKIEVVKE